MHKKNIFIVASYNELNSLTFTFEGFGNTRPKVFCGFLYDPELDSWFRTPDVLVENYFAVRKRSSPWLLFINKIVEHLSSLEFSLLAGYPVGSRPNVNRYFEDKFRFGRFVRGSQLVFSNSECNLYFSKLRIEYVFRF